MKKYILSLLLIGTFGLYTLYTRSGGSTDVALFPNSEVTIPNTPPPSSIGQYKDGVYTGISANAYYGNIQVKATILGGKITDVQFLDYPQDRGTSVRINSQAMPYLRQEAIQAQSANVHTVSGASDSSGAFRQSLASALLQAKNS